MRVTPGFGFPFHVKNPQALPLRPLARGFMRVTVQNESGAFRSSQRDRANRDPTPYAGRIFASSNTVLARKTRETRSEIQKKGWFLGRSRIVVEVGRGEENGKGLGHVRLGLVRTKSTARFARCTYCDFGPAAILTSPNSSPRASTDVQKEETRLFPRFRYTPPVPPKDGAAGFRSPYLPHAKRSLCQMSYSPVFSPTSQ